MPSHIARNCTYEKDPTLFDDDSPERVGVNNRLELKVKNLTLGDPGSLHSSLS